MTLHVDGIWVNSTELATFINALIIKADADMPTSVIVAMCVIAAVPLDLGGVTIALKRKHAKGE